MKRKAFYSLLLSSLLLLSGCGITVNSDTTIDNAYNNWSISYSDGYAGGGVIFGTQNIVGLWSTHLTTLNNPYANDPFDHTYYVEDEVYGIAFDSSDYLEFWSDGFYEEWISIDYYRVSRDGKVLRIGDDSFYHLESYTNGCMLIEHLQSTNEYLMCREF